MKQLIRYGLLVAFVVGTFSSRAQTTYYVASNGNDTNDGRSIDRPFQSLGRVNSLVLGADDAVLFRRGDTFRGTLQIKQSGSLGKPIRFDAYGNGPKPVLAGSVPVQNWIQVRGNVWQAQCAACGNRVTGVYLNGLAQPLGRYPNADDSNRGSLTVQTHVGMNQLTSQENLTTDWTGAEVVVRPTYWIIDRATVTKQTGNTLLLNNSSSYNLTDGWGFFMQKHPATLDRPGEWYYNPANSSLQLYSNQGNPNQQLITATVQDQVIDVTNVKFIRIQNLRITQARSYNLKALNTSNLVVNDNDFTDSGEDGVVIQGEGSHIRVENCRIINSNNNGFYIGSYQDVIFRKNSIRRTGLLPGQGKSGDGQFIAFQSFAKRGTLIENNTIDSVGYIGISVQSKSIIRQNLIANFCMTKTDGGGIYLWNGPQLPSDSTRIESNIISKGIGTPGGLSSTVIGGAHGIFLDDCVTGVDLVENTITDCQGLGIYLHSVNHVNLIRNTCFNNAVGQLILYNYDIPCKPRNNTFNQNIFLAKTAAQPVVAYISGEDDLRSFGSMNHNYYARPFNDLSTIRAVYNQSVVSDLNVSQWQKQFSEDLTSWPSPITYKDYVVKHLSNSFRIGSSPITDPDGWDTWSVYNNGRVNWNTSSSSLTVKFANSSGHSDSYALVYKGIQSVTKSRNYLVQFDVAAPADKNLVVFIRQRKAPYKDLSKRYEFLAGSTRKHYEFAFTALADEADALLTFQVSEDEQPVWLYNIHFQEATIERVNPDDYIRLAFNPTQADSIVVLHEPYRDVKNHYYARQITLKPFASAVLLRDTLPPVDIRLSLRSAKPSLHLGEVTSVSLTLHNVSTNRTSLANQVKWSCQLPANLIAVNQVGVPIIDSVLTGMAQQLLTDTTFVFRVKPIKSGQYILAAQVVASTYADPSSTPDSGTEDGEDDQASVVLQVDNTLVIDTPVAGLVTAITLPNALIEPSRIYPNPTPDEFTYVAEDDIVNVRLMDILGRERFTLDTIRQGQTVRFGQALPDAYYLLIIKYKTGEQRAVKLIKQSR
ncbi:right-handed parallel beta-helix repeat-containing protein [Spirosoma profusum]|nr:right-handed parallel beta-helix repeat-containing protein [Spirosoma profusum]